MTKTETPALQLNWTYTMKRNDPTAAMRRCVSVTSNTPYAKIVSWTVVDNDPTDFAHTPVR